MENTDGSTQGITNSIIDGTYLDVTGIDRAPGFGLTSAYVSGAELKPTGVVAEPSKRIVLQSERGEHRLIETSAKNKVSSEIAKELSKITGEEFNVERVDALRSRIAYEDPIVALTDHLKRVQDSNDVLNAIKGATLKSAVKSLLLTAKGEPALRQGRIERIVLALRKNKYVALFGRLNFPGFTLGELLKRNSLTDAIKISFKVSKQALKLYQDVRRAPEKIVDKVDLVKALENRRSGLMRRAMKNFAKISDKVNSLNEEEKTALGEVTKAKASLLEEVRKSIPGFEESSLDTVLAKSAEVTIKTSIGKGKTTERTVFQSTIELIQLIETETKTPQTDNLKLFALNVLVDIIYKKTKRAAGLQATIACFPVIDQTVFSEKVKIKNEAGNEVMVDRISVSDFAEVFLNKDIRIGSIDNVKVNALLENNGVDRDLKETVRRYLGDPLRAGRNKVEAVAGSVVNKIRKTPRVTGVIAEFNRQVTEFLVMSEKILHERELVAEYMPLVGTLSAIDNIPLFDGQNLMALAPSKTITDADGTTHIIRPRGLSILQNTSWTIKSLFNKDIGLSSDPYSSLSELSSDRLRVTTIIGAVAIAVTLLGSTLYASSVDQARRRTIRCVSVTQNLSYAEIQQKYGISASSVQETISKFNFYRSELYPLFKTGDYTQLKLDPENWKGILDVNGPPYVNENYLSSPEEMKSAIYRAATLTLLELQKQNNQPTDKLNDKSTEDLKKFMSYLAEHKDNLADIFYRFYKDENGIDYLRSVKRGDDTIKSSDITEIIKAKVNLLKLLENFDSSLQKAMGGIEQDCK